MAREATEGTDCPEPVRDHAAQAVAYVKGALGVEIEFDSDTLPVLDHYLRNVPDEPSAIVLVASTAGAYFGEVVRRSLGGRWDLSAGDPADWRLVLPTGLSFAPAGVVAEAILQDDSVDLGSRFDAPPKLVPHVEAALERMGDVTVEEYFSLCGRYDTLTHLQAVVLAIAAKLAAEKA